MDPFAPWRDTIPLAAGVPRRKRAQLREAFESAPIPPRKRRHFAAAADALAARLFEHSRRLLIRVRGGAAVVDPIPAIVED